jgi:hypothetical protein
MKSAYSLTQSEKLELSALYGGGNLADELTAREAMEEPSERATYSPRLAIDSRGNLRGGCIDLEDECQEGGRFEGLHPSHARQAMRVGTPIGWQW